jgi:hypothetical protein
LAFPHRVDRFWEVGRMNYSRQALQRRISQSMLIDEGFERAAIALVLVRITGARSIEADGALALLDRRNLPGLDKQKDGCGVDEAADEPWRCGSRGCSGGSPISLLISGLSSHRGRWRGAVPQPPQAR